MLGQASVALDLHAFEPFKAQPASVELLGNERKVHLSQGSSLLRPWNTKHM